MSCLNSKLFLSRLCTPSPQLTSPNPHTSAPHTPAGNLPLPRQCGSKGSVGSSLLFPPLSLFFLSQRAPNICRLLHAFQTPGACDLPILWRAVRAGGIAGHPVHATLPSYQGVDNGKTAKNLPNANITHVFFGYESQYI